MPLLAALFSFVSVVASTSAVLANDTEHWLTPSQQHVDPNTLFEAGVPDRPPSAERMSRSQLQGEGRVLYDVHCSSCHGANLKGTGGVPTLQRAGGAATDFYLTTGRMPLADIAADSGDPHASTARTMTTGTQAYHAPALLDAHQIAALEAYVDASVAQTTPIPRVVLDSKTLQRGRRLFEDNCEACHGAAAEGATVGYQWTALPLRKATPTQIGEAVRIGPGVMPNFTTAQLSDDDVDAIATYARYLATQPQTYGGTVMDYLGPTAEGVVGGFIGIGFLFWVVYFTGTKADGRRLNEID